MDERSIRIPAPQVRIWVFRGHSLHSRAANCNCDPYVSLRLLDEKGTLLHQDHDLRTETKRATSNPVWRAREAGPNEQLPAPHVDLTHLVGWKLQAQEAQKIHTIEFTAWDEERPQKAFMGQVALTLGTDVTDGSVFERWLPLQPRPGKAGRKDRVAGEIHVMVDYKSAGLLLQEQEAERQAREAAEAEARAQAATRRKQARSDSEQERLLQFLVECKTEGTAAALAWSTFEEGGTWIGELQQGLETMPLELAILSCDVDTAACSARLSCNSVTTEAKATFAHKHGQLMVEITDDSVRLVGSFSDDFRRLEGGCVSLLPDAGGSSSGGLLSPTARGKTSRGYFHLLHPRVWLRSESTLERESRLEEEEREEALREQEEEQLLQARLSSDAAFRVAFEALRPASFWEGKLRCPLLLCLRAPDVAPPSPDSRSSEEEEEKTVTTVVREEIGVELSVRERRRDGTGTGTCAFELPGAAPLLLDCDFAIGSSVPLSPSSEEACCADCAAAAASEDDSSSLNITATDSLASIYEEAEDSDRDDSESWEEEQEEEQGPAERTAAAITIRVATGCGLVLEGTFCRGGRRRGIIGTVHPLAADTAEEKHRGRGSGSTASIAGCGAAVYPERQAASDERPTTPHRKHVTSVTGDLPRGTFTLCRHETRSHLDVF